MNYTLMEKVFAAIRRPHLAFRYLMGKQPGEFDLAEVACFVSADEPKIVEAGAFDGRDSKAFAERWPRGHVYAFEPHPVLAEKVRARVLGLPNVTVIEAALADNVSSVVSLFGFCKTGAPHGSSSLLEPEDHLLLAPEVRFGEQIEVPAMTLDAWHASIGKPRIDLLWLDLQGAELRVLRHGALCLAATHVLHVEVSHRPLYRDGATFQEMQAFLTSHGFRLAKARVPVRTGNAIFVRAKPGVTP